MWDLTVVESCAWHSADQCGMLRVIQSSEGVHPRVESAFDLAFSRSQAGVIAADKQAQGSGTCLSMAVFLHDCLPLLAMLPTRSVNGW